MPILKLIFFAGVVVLGAIAVFIGAIVMLTSWQHGAITLSYSQAGNPVTETISKATDAARFWRLYAQLGVAPLVLGAVAVWYGIRTFRS